MNGYEIEGSRSVPATAVRKPPSEEARTWATGSSLRPAWSRPGALGELDMARAALNEADVD